MECINSQNHESRNSQHDALLMSFLDDSQVEDYCDNEKLSSMIRSLEAVIDQGIIHVDQYVVDNNNSNWMNDHLSGHDHQEELEGYDESTSISQHGLDCNWMEIEMDHMAPSSPRDGFAANWYMDPCGAEMDNATTEFGNEMNNYFEHFNGISFEDHELGSYSPFWQEPLAN